MEAKIKICRVIDIETAVRLVEQGIDFLGFHIITESDITLLDTYSAINSFLIESLGFNNSVLVTKIDAGDIITNRLMESNFNYIQFHYVLSPTIQKLLREYDGPKQFICIYDPTISDRSYFNKLQSISKYVIVDNIKGGQGKRIELHQDTLPNYDNVFIAGGINAENIKELYNNFRPFGFDIQSSCEIEKGVKDFNYIKKIQHALS